ncbi:Outer membrane receptor proteins, mostly Fe transport [Spirosomataceae bacterium TFI 002]|nr:Outer membrane receptor proteins, mostly Fe transport [Spirosomataceae bacterium TFI 002]
MTKNLLLFILIFTLGNVKAQSSIDFILVKEDNGKKLEEVMEEKKKKYGLHIIFQNDHLIYNRISGVSAKKDIIRYIETANPSQKAIELEENLFIIVDREMKSELTALDNDFNVFFVPSDETVLKGELIDIEENIPIGDAILYNSFSKTGSKSNSDGTFQLASTQVFQLAEVRHPNYKRQVFAIIRYDDKKSQNVQVKTESKANYLDEFVVHAKSMDANIDSEKSGISTLSIATIKQLPTFLGEVDPIRSITTLPGVTSSGDLGGGFNVRGGETSQNLILQDGALIFNPSHLFGFFSAFNPDLIKDVQLLKGCGPASYGGRVASVLNIETRNGDLSDFKVKGGLGLVSSRLTLEGPIKKGQASFLLSGRLAYSDWIIKRYNDIELKKSDANFNDVTAKIFSSLGNKTTLSLTAYRSDDSFRFGEGATYYWKSENLSGAIDHQFSSGFFTTFTLANSNYESKEEDDDELFGYKNRNVVNVTNGILHFELQKLKNTNLQWGISINKYDLKPGIYTPYSDQGLVESQNIEDQQGLEMAYYAESTIEVNPKLAFNLGLRYAMFIRNGGTKLNLDYENRNGRLPSIINQETIASDSKLAEYGGLEPRVSARLKINDKTALKASYSRTQQFIHQISTTISPSPVDYWVLSSNNLKPLINDQVSLGVFHNSSDNKYETSLELYANKTANAIDYLDGVDLKQNPLFELGLTNGVGQAYGLEMMLKKTLGKVNGYLSYTFSRSYRQFVSQYEGHAINEGERYPSVFDQPHQASFILNWHMAKRVFFSSNITYNSGRPITIPISKYSYDDILAINNYSLRNQYRSPNYQRVDISLTFKGKQMVNKVFTGDLIFSVFNVLGRKNPYAIWFDNTGQAFKTSILATVFPSLTYNFSI